MTPGELHQQLFDEGPTAYAVLDLVTGELHFWKPVQVPLETDYDAHASYLRRREEIYEILVREQIANGLTASEIDALDLEATAASMASERVPLPDAVIVETWKAPATASKTPGTLRAWRTRQLRQMGVTWDADKSRPNPEHESWRMRRYTAWRQSDQLSLTYAHDDPRRSSARWKMLNDGIDITQVYDRDGLEEALRRWDDRVAQDDDEEGG